VQSGCEASAHLTGILGNEPASAGVNVGYVQFRTARSRAAYRAPRGDWSATR
jgi:hypothetical protein